MLPFPVQDKSPCARNSELIPQQQRSVLGSQRPQRLFAPVRRTRVQEGLQEPLQSKSGPFPSCWLAEPTRCAEQRERPRCHHRLCGRWLPSSPSAAFASQHSLCCPLHGMQCHDPSANRSWARARERPGLTWSEDVAVSGARSRTNTAASSGTGCGTTGMWEPS